MQSYKHISLVEREKLYAWKEQGVSLRTIAARLHRNVGTISRELKRHTKYGKPYLPCLAQRQADRWTARQRYQAPLKSPLVFLFVRHHLRDLHWSPEKIAGRLAKTYPGYTIDDETIYRYIYGKRQKRMKLWKYLVRHRKHRLACHGRKVKAVSSMDYAVPIVQRPLYIQKRKQIGHWETDNLEGKRSDTSAISVTVERVTRIVRLAKLNDLSAHTKTDAILSHLKQEKAWFCRSLTVDRGPENRNHGQVAKTLDIPVYACAPYHSWEKGTVENMNGRIRQYIPKGTSVDGITQGDLTILEEVLNNTPMKVLGFLTPYEKLEKILSASHIL